MSFWGRLFGARPPPPAPNNVVIAEDVAGPLTADGTALAAAVDSALRSYLDARAKAAAAGEPERIPFWLRRESAGEGQIEDELRDRIIQRRAAEDEKT
ncbi:MAG: hypothetical protein E6J45_06705 [Chloroflexi bacterium]|nr:MAG: hypothetical protein E6J45_06705 [Chloroflexota bacterium]